MAIIKCKMCGGDLELIPDSTVCECEYCGTRQTVPSADSEKMLSLFHRAGKLLRACEFDKAYGVYESIVNEFPDEAEAYWGLVLCSFGIEYVDDPVTGKKVPTCHRAGFESVEDDVNFEQACENADAVARRVYREEGRAIDELRERIIEVSGREEPYDVFISYKELAEDGERTEDSVLAQDIYDALTAKGYRVFFSRITLEDKLGVEYEPYIFAALQSAKVMLLVGMDYENLNAVWVKNEWSRYLALMAQNKEKVLIPCYKNMDPYDLPKEVRKLAAQDMGKVGAMQDLLRGVEKILPLKKAELAAPAPQQVVVSGGPNVTALQKRGAMALEDGQWGKAKDFFDQVLNMDAENAEAWLGLALADLRVKHESDLSALADGWSAVADNANFEKFLRFASAERKQEINAHLDAAEAERQAQRRREIEARKQREAENAVAREAFRSEQPGLMKKLAPAQRVLKGAPDRIFGLKLDGTVVGKGKEFNNKCDVMTWKDIKAIAVGDEHTVGLRADGTVVATAGDPFKRLERPDSENLVNIDSRGFVSHWEDVVAIAAGKSHIVGLRADGTVLASGDNLFGQCKVSGWKEIVSIQAGGSRTVGIKRDGTVVASGRNNHGQCNVSEWRNIISVAMGDLHTVGLRSDGTVVAVGYNEDGRCDVSDWTDVVAIAVGNGFTVGLRANGTVVAVGNDENGQCRVSDWDHVVAVSTDMFSLHLAALRSDGTVLATGYNEDGRCEVSDWRDIVSVAVFGSYTVGLRSNGTVIIAGDAQLNGYVSGWKLFNSINTLEADRNAVIERAKSHSKAEKEKRISELMAEKNELESKLSSISSLFGGSKKAKIEARLAEIASELKTLGAE